MASMASRMSMFGENLYGDKEKDANSLLMELDKGIRSCKVGEQCEAIVRYPRLFEKYPFPILINSAFLKVADVFRCGSNFLRMCVLQVTQQSEKHLEKITNIDEFVKRIYSVIRSTDPVARAITLRTLGSVACIISERKIVHHSIINSLDSHDKIELESAIVAASLFAAKSKSFSNSICSKLTEMIECLSIPVDMKLKLISVFDLMTCDLETSQRARSLCTSVLHSYPSRKFVQATLHTLTLLSARSLVDIPQQLELLLHYLTCDARRAVKLSVLHDLHLLAHKAPHMWTLQHVISLCEFVSTNVADNLQLGAVSILSVLSRTVAVTRLSSSEPNSPVMECCLRCCYHENKAIMVKAAEMLVGIVLQAERDGDLNQSDEQVVTVSSALEMSLAVCTSDDSTKENKKVLETCLKSITRLCEVFPDIARHFIDVITTSLTRGKDVNALELCECLSAIGSIDGALLQSLVPDVAAVLRTLINLDCERNPDLMLSLVRLLLHACFEDGLPDEVVALVKAVEAQVDGWTAYKIGRQATRYGHHSLAKDIFGALKMATSTEHYYFWMNALKDCCAGESCLQQVLLSQDSREEVTQSTRSDFIDKMAAAEANYHMGIVALKAAATPTQPLTFQVEYFQLRTKLIESYVLVVRACCSFQMSPPPAIATSLALTTGLDGHRCDHVLLQLKNCAQRFKELEQKYQALYRSSFDADLGTLNNLDVLLQTCRLMMFVIESILYPTRWKGGAEFLRSSTLRRTSEEKSRGGVEQQLWTAMKSQVLELLQKTLQVSPNAPLTHQQISCIEQTAMLIGRGRHCFPRYIFQRLQTTDIKVAISPSPRSAGEPILIHYDAQLTLKVEGVIQTNGSLTNRSHRVHTVQLLVVSKLESRTPPTGAATDGKVQENPTNRMIQTVQPHNDYFSTHFLLVFPVTGQHLISVEASIGDEDGVVWHAGPRTSVVVRSYDEAAIKQAQMKYAERH